MFEELDAILAAIPLFNTLEPAERAALVKLKTPQSFTADQPILVEGQPPNGLYIILSGKVAVMKNRAGGGDRICDLDAGECVGELEIIDGSACSASVVCYGDVETAVITKENLEAYFVAQPAAATKILRQMVHILATRLKETNVSYSTLMTIAEGAD